MLDNVGMVNSKNRFSIGVWKFSLMLKEPLNKDSRNQLYWNKFDLDYTDQSMKVDGERKKSYESDWNISADILLILLNR